MITGNQTTTGIIIWKFCKLWVTIPGGWISWKKLIFFYFKQLQKILWLIGTCIGLWFEGKKNGVI